MDYSEVEVIDLCDDTTEIATLNRASACSPDCSAFEEKDLCAQSTTDPEKIPIATDGEVPSSSNYANFFDISYEEFDTIVTEDKRVEEKKRVSRRKNARGNSAERDSSRSNLKGRKKVKPDRPKPDKVQAITAERILGHSSILIDPAFTYAKRLEEEIERNLTVKMKKCRSETGPNYVESRSMVWKNVIGFSRPRIESLISGLDIVMDEEVLWVLEVQEFIKLAYNTVNASPMDFPDVGVATLPERAAELEDQFHPMKVRITALVLNLPDYFKDLRKYEAAVIRSRVANKETAVTKGRFPILSDCGVIVSEYQVTQALVHLQMDKSICCYLVDGLQEVAEQAIGTCRAIAEREYKAHRMDVHNFSFLPEGEVAKGVRVDRATGSGYMKLWKQVLEQCFGRCFPEGAEAIAKKYGCPRALLGAYDRLSLVEEKEKLLANIVVETKNGFNRRLGEAYSKKVFLAFTSKDPDLVLSSSRFI